MKASRPTMIAFGICAIGSETAYHVLFGRTSDEQHHSRRAFLKSNPRSVVATTSAETLAVARATRIAFTRCAAPVAGGPFLSSPLHSTRMRGLPAAADRA